MGLFYDSLRRAGAGLILPALRSLSSDWAPYSKLMLVSDGANWVISEELRAVAGVAQKLGIEVVDAKWLHGSQAQSVFFGTRYALLNGKEITGSHRVAMTWFHGKPGTGFAEFDETYHALCRLHESIHRIQVSHTEMRDIILESGIDPAKVFLIPIGVENTLFAPRTCNSQKEARQSLGIPMSAVVIGSFQKDGIGWGAGMEPKPIKGPDVFLNAIRILRDRLPDLYVLLSGPARGYVKAGLEALGVPYKHIYLKSYQEIGELYHALDVYIVASRQEGGPKAILESMVSGVPIVTTRVGQAMDILKHGINGWMVDVGDAEGLAHWAEHCINMGSDVKAALEQGILVAAENTYDAQIPLWKDFMKGFVKLHD